VQRSLKGYGKHEDCNKLSFAEFQRALDAERLERPEPDRSRRIDFANDVWPEIERVTACALGATLGCGTPRDGGDHDARRSRNLAQPGATFEVFGLDFMLARDGSPALIEINTSPALFRHGEVLRTTLPKMMEEVCRLTLDCVFPAPPGHERVASAGSRPEPPRRFRKLDVVVDLAVASQRADRARKGARSASEKGTGPIPPRERVGARAPSRALED
jgi:hypothetical protein